MRFTTDSCADCAQNIIRLEDRTIRRNGLSDIFVKVARISDAGCASIPDQAEALLVEIFVQAAATLQGQKGGKTSAQLCQQVADQHPNLASISGLKLVKGRHPVHPTNTNHHKHSKAHAMQQTTPPRSENVYCIHCRTPDLLLTFAPGTW